MGTSALQQPGVYESRVDMTFFVGWDCHTPWTGNLHNLVLSQAVYHGKFHGMTVGAFRSQDPFLGTSSYHSSYWHVSRVPAGALLFCGTIPETNPLGLGVFFNMIKSSANAWYNQFLKPILGDGDDGDYDIWLTTSTWLRGQRTWVFWPNCFFFGCHFLGEHN